MPLTMTNNEESFTKQNEINKEDYVHYVSVNDGSIGFFNSRALHTTFTQTDGFHFLWRPLGSRWAPGGVVQVIDLFHAITLCYVGRVQVRIPISGEEPRTAGEHGRHF